MNSNYNDVRGQFQSSYAAFSRSSVWPGTCNGRSPALLVVSGSRTTSHCLRWVHQKPLEKRESRATQYHDNVYDRAVYDTELPCSRV